jgi:predicted O-methyltransferase YrrM
VVSKGELARTVRAFAVTPVTAWRALPGEYRQRRGSPQYDDGDLDRAWLQHLHGLLGAPWPCPESELLNELMTDISARLAAQGLASGRHTYGWYSDAEISLCSAVWCAVTHGRPEIVVETGVAHGVTSRVILEVLRRSGRGHLSSIDLPHPLDDRLHAQTGAAVTDECRERWSYLEGSSRDRLPQLIAEVGRVDLFVHDSLHTAKNVLFEMELAASAMRPGGIMLVDDIKSHNGFMTFARRHPDYRTIVCESADQIGVFGIAVRTALA